MLVCFSSVYLLFLCRIEIEKAMKKKYIPPKDQDEARDPTLEYKAVSETELNWKKEDDKQDYFNILKPGVAV